jgi:hypothetical protein
MNKKTKGCFRPAVAFQSRFLVRNNQGQALVEFTLIFALLLVLIFIPADFGIAFFTSQLAQSASREGARIAAADPNLPGKTGVCALPCSGEPNDGTSILRETADRISSALLSGGTVRVEFPINPDDGYVPPPPPEGEPPAEYPGVKSCNLQVRVTVSGTYNYFFYPLLNLIGVSVNPAENITRITEKRWEHQGC